MQYIKTIRIRWTILIAAAMTGGCAHNFQSSSDHIQQPEQTLEQVVVCCESFAELSYQILPPNYRAIISLDSDDPVMELESGKSYIEPIALPESNGITLLQIDSKVSHRNIIQAPTMVYPVVTLLDSQYRVVSTLNDLPYKFVNPVIGARRIEMTATIDHSDKDIRYALIHTSPDRLNQSLSARRPFQIFQNDAFDSLIYGNPTITRKRVEFVSHGVLSVLAYTVDND